MALTNEEIGEQVERIGAAAPFHGASTERARQPFALERTWREGARYVGLRIRVDDVYAAAYQRPGQYTTLQVGEQAARFFAIASAPGAGTGWEFLVDAESEAGLLFDALADKTPIAVSMPEGRGFPVEQAVARPVLLFTTGSGVATMRACLDYWERNPQLRPSAAALYYGEASGADFAFCEDLERWRAWGVRVFLAQGQCEDPTTGYRYVQQAFEADRPLLEDAFVFLSGASVMLRAVAEKLLLLGVSPQQLFTNV
ncbi:MAG: hypothetical protein H0U74_19005 [Bradymonadaceae bacterium]|nr:hypothetical protein [Lujinxingiaceae bacterium]